MEEDKGVSPEEVALEVYKKTKLTGDMVSPRYPKRQKHPCHKKKKKIENESETP